MFGMEHQHDVENARLFLGKGTIGAKHGKDGFRRAFPRNEMMDIQRLAEEFIPHRAIGKNRDAGQAGQQHDRRVDLMSVRTILSVLIEGVQL